MQIPRIGLGYDVHQLADGESLILGGVRIEHSKGTVAHSDGDVLLHAIADALLGAAAVRDIGYHFPDTDTKYKNIDSAKILAEVNKLLQNNGYHIGNIDATISLQKPKLSPYIEQMQANIAKTLCCQQNQISIKATTTEKLGFVGKEAGIAVHAVALIYKNPNK